MLQEALVLCSELRSFGNSLLSALDESDAEQLQLLRERHVASIAKLVRNSRFLQWKEAEADTEAVLASRGAVLERHRHSGELEHYSRQIIMSLLREQLTKAEYESQLKTIDYLEKADSVGELSRLYVECYRLAFDIAKRAEQTLRHELMCPEFDERDFIASGDWGSARTPWMAGETLSHDLERLELSYRKQRRHEHTMTKHVSLAHLDPLALHELEATGRCEFTVPESLFELDSPGQYMRRLESVALSIPCNVGSTGLPCKLSLVRSSIRLDGDGQVRNFVRAIESIVTSTEPADEDPFEPEPRDEYYLPFAGAGAIGTWRLELPDDVPQLDYGSVSDVVLHLRYTARAPGVSARHS